MLHVKLKCRYNISIGIFFQVFSAQKTTEIRAKYFVAIITTMRSVFSVGDKINVLYTVSLVKNEQQQVLYASIKHVAVVHLHRQVDYKAVEKTINSSIIRCLHTQRIYPSCLLFTFQQKAFFFCLPETLLAPPALN